MKTQSKYTSLRMKMEWSGWRVRESMNQRNRLQEPRSPHFAYVSVCTLRVRRHMNTRQEKGRKTVALTRIILW